MKIRVLVAAIFLLSTLQCAWGDSDSFERPRLPASTPIHTFDLLNQADRVLTFDPIHKDVVVLVGHSAAGSTTVGKILSANCAPPEACYSNVHERYFNLDLSADRFEPCPLSSQLPGVMTSPENGIPFYVLPHYRGSSSMCSNSTQLGLVLLSRRLAQHAKSIKILLIADYKLMFESGGYFMDLLEAAFIFSPSLDTFSNSVGLVATNVDSSKTDVVIINEIKNFITRLKDRLSYRDSSDPAIAQVVTLLASLVQDGNNGQPKIYFPRVPTRPGRRSDPAEMVDIRTKLADLVFRGLGNSSLSPSDLRYVVNDTDMEALESVLKEILKYIVRLQRRFESVLTELYSSEAGYLRQLPPQQLMLIYSARNAQELFPDDNDESAPTKIPFWVTAYIIKRTMSALEGVMIPLDSSFTSVWQELKDKENVLRAVYEILGARPDEDTLKVILHPGDEISASWFQPLTDYQSTFCAQLNTDTAEPCSNLTNNVEDISASPKALKRRCILGKLICTVLNEFGVPVNLSPAAANSLEGERLSNSTVETADVNVPLLPNRNGTALESTLESIYHFTASQLTSSLNTFSREHTPDQLPPSKQIILHEFTRDLTLVQLYQEFMNGTRNVPFIIMSSFLRSSIKAAKDVLVPYNSSSAGLTEQLEEQEKAFRLVHEILGTLGEGGDAESSSGQEKNNSASEALANLGSKYCPRFETAVIGTVCGNIGIDGSNNGAADVEAKEQCSISKVVCTMLQELWQ